MTPPVKSVVIGTAGHIDHGKTALVRALTGIDADRLPEEKRRGITIDLGFAFLEAQSSAGSPLRISFVDVPGHSLFIHNMLAGAGCIGAAMLVISAEEGVKPQTVEHLAICQLLGVRTGLTVITKIDAVASSRIAEVELEVKKFLRGSFLGDGRAEVLAVSAFTGQNLADLRQKLVRLAEEAEDSDLEHVPRLPIDRAFVMKGFGTVVTGTLLAGKFSTGQSLSLEPGESIVRVRGMQTHGRAEELVVGGSRVALNLAGVEVSEVSRGQTLVPSGTLTAVSSIDVEAWLLPGASPVKHGSQVHFHAFTSNTVADALIYGEGKPGEGKPGGGKFEAGSRRLLRIKLRNPILLTAGDPFVLRQVSPPATIGGGRVLDATPLPRLRKIQTIEWLEKLRGATPEERVFLRIARRGSQGLSRQRLTGETGLSQEAAQRVLQQLIASHEIVKVSGEILVDRVALETAFEAIRGVLGKHANGLKRSELRNRTSLRPEIFDFSLDHLVGAGRLNLNGELVSSLQTGKASIAPDPALAAVTAIYRQAGLFAPLVSEVAASMKRKEAEIRALITLLLRKKVLVPMGSENLFIHQEALARLRSEISELHGQMLDVARFKEMTGLSRKYAIPLLEYLDRQSITRKLGDQRLVL
ncbi:MAG: selenocysteine-specific translation elongation factor [Acidobacteriaceae bacterium]